MRTDTAAHALVLHDRLCRRSAPVRTLTLRERVVGVAINVVAVKVVHVVLSVRKLAVA